MWGEGGGPLINPDGVCIFALIYPLKSSSLQDEN